MSLQVMKLRQRKKPELKKHDEARGIGRWRTTYTLPHTSTPRWQHRNGNTAPVITHPLSLSHRLALPAKSPPGILALLMLNSMAADRGVGAAGAEVDMCSRCSDAHIKEVFEAFEQRNVSLLTLQPGKVADTVRLAGLNATKTALQAHSNKVMLC
jgi:hypothetical protein